MREAVEQLSYFEAVDLKPAEIVHRMKIPVR